MKLLFIIISLICSFNMLNGQTINSKIDQDIALVNKAYLERVPFELVFEISNSKLPVKLTLPEKMKYKIVQGLAFKYVNANHTETILTEQGTLRIDHASKRIQFSSLSTLKEDRMGSNFISEILKSVIGENPNVEITKQEQDNELTVFKYQVSRLRYVDVSLDLERKELKQIKKVSELPSTAMTDIQFNLDVINQKFNIKSTDRYSIQFFGSVNDNNEFIANQKYSDYKIISY